MDESLSKLFDKLKTKLANTEGNDVELNWYEVLYLLEHVSRVENVREPVYYIALDTFPGSHDMFWRSEIYTIVEIECNGFTIDGLIKEGKIQLWQGVEE